MYYTNEALEQFYIRYQAEGIPAKQSMQEFCSANKVPYNIFLKWYKDTRRKIVPVQLSGVTEEPAGDSGEAAQKTIPATSATEPEREKPLRIMVDIKISNGLHIRQRNLSPAAFLRLAENLENLC